MKYINKKSGFSAVELLITLFIAAAFLISGYQLYAVVIKDGGEARMQSNASNVATDYLQRYKSSATNPCTTQTPLTDSAITVTGLSNVTTSVAISCPYSTTYSATGGVITTSGAYTIHTFTTNGTFTVSGAPIADASILVVGGGGSGGGGLTAVAHAGGGGGGGILEGNMTIPSGTTTVTIGAGGVGVAQRTQGNSGGNSSFGTYIAYGGGGGGGYISGGQSGLAGGSGGGGSGGMSSTNAGATTQTSQSPLTGYGFAGAAGSTGSESGAGGGAGGLGGVPTRNIMGPGRVSSISGTAVTYAYGGYSSGTSGGSVGQGGHGNADTIPSGSGGTGVIIIKYLTPTSSSITSVSKILVTIKYGTPQQIITNATYVKP